PAFGSVGGGPVVLDAVHFLGQLPLGDHPAPVVVGIAVADAVAEVGGAPVVAVAQVRGDRAEPAGAHVADGPVDGGDHRVGLGGQRDVDDRLGEVDARLGQADQVHGLGGGDRHLQRGGVGHAHVLAGVHHEAAGDETRVLPRLDHAGEVVQGRVDVAAAHAFDERADRAVVLVGGAVVAHGGAVGGALHVGHGDLGALPRDQRGGLQVGERPPGVSPGEPHQVVEGLLGEGVASAEAAFVGERAPHD